ncbi:DinB family protein [Niabella terrae]
MTKAYFQQLAGYNCWANQEVRQWIGALDDEQWQQPVTSSFSSIAATVLHIISAENIWLQRLQQLENTVWLQSSYRGSKSEHIELWEKVSASIKTHIDQMEEVDFDRVLEYRRLNGMAFRTPNYQVLAHLFNHSTYHRGQLVTMFRTVGFEKISSTDMVNYFRID